MNIFKKIYCRIYQQIFRIVLPLMPYRQPQILSSMDQIPAVIQANNCHNCLLVTGKASVKLGLADKLAKTLKEKNIACVIYDQTVPNPTTANVIQAKDLYLQKRCDCIIGLGGGSAMDCAKAVGAMIVQPHKTLNQMQGILKVRKSLPLLIAIPTTAGTGSETTVASVIVDSNTRHKYAINDFCLIPQYAVLDPEMTLSLPPKLTSTTGLDALTHAVEAYIGQSTTAYTRKEAESAVKLIFENLPKAYQNGNDIAARKNMLLASYQAGCAFTRSYVGYVHAIAHSLGGKYDISHGLANAVILPYVLEDYGNTCQKQLAALAVVCHMCSQNTPPKQAQKIFLQNLKNLNEQLNIPHKIKELKAEDIPYLAKQADKEANPLYPVPLLMDNKELEKIYRRLLEKEF